MTTPCHALASPASPPLPVACFTVEHAAQRQAAGHTAKTLGRVDMTHDEVHVTARPFAAASGKIRARFRWALALARCRLVSCRLDSGPFTPPLPTTLVLHAPLLLAVRAGAITPAGSTTTPLPRRRAAGRAAITTLRTRRPIPLFTALQQTAPRAVRRTALLSRTRREGILRWAHGSNRLPGLSLGDERLTRLRGVLVGTAGPA